MMYAQTRPSYSLEILVNGRPIETYSSKSGEVWVEGRKGTEYSIRVYNRTSSDICAIVSVDGLSVVDGNPAGDSSDGYIVPAHGSIDIPGWKVNDQQAAKFVFESVPRSYSARTDQGTANVGVIGLMVFTKKPEPTGWLRNAPPIWGSSAGSQDPILGEYNADLSGIAPTNQAGTGWGNTTAHYSRPEEFVKASSFAAEILAIYYDDRKGLEKRGIYIPQKYAEPQPFPAYHYRGSGCKPPLK